MVLYRVRLQGEDTFPMVWKIAAFFCPAIFYSYYSGPWEWSTIFDYNEGQRLLGFSIVTVLYALNVLNYL